MNPLAGKFKFGTKEHTDLSRKVTAMLVMSKTAFEDRHAQFAKNEEQYSAYIPASEVDTLRKRGRDTAGEMDYTTIEVPYSFAVLMTAHTYYTSVFLARNPVFQFQGRHGEGEDQIQAVEALFDYNLSAGMNLPQLFVWLHDPGRYGYGIVGYYWDKEVLRKRSLVEVQPTFLGTPIPFAKPKPEWQVQEIPGYEGFRLFNVRPADFFPDPRVSLVNFQRGEFCGRYVEIPWHEVVQRERDGRYFNLDVIREGLKTDQQHDSGGLLLRDRGSSRVTTLPGTVATDMRDVPVGVLKGYELQVRLNPAAWGFDNQSSKTELWVISIDVNGVVFAIEPVEAMSTRFQFEVLTSEPEAYNLFPVSSLERIKPLNDALSWLLNTHFYNVRATLNNQFVFDPSMVVVKDVEDKRPGKLIRLKPTAYGRDVRSVISQLQTVDVTRTHIADMHLVSEIIQRTLGVSDNTMGLVNTGGRKSATEIRHANAASVSRLKTQCEWFSVMGFSPLATGLLQMVQNNYTVEKKFRIVGDTAAQAPEFATVTPEAIAGFFDWIPVDGTLPIDRYAQVNMWGQLLAQVARMPQVLAQYDLGRIFGWVAGLGGIRNVNRFKIKVSDPMALNQAVQAGNVVPLRDAERTIEPGQIPGMGATG